MAEDEDDDQWCQVDFKESHVYDDWVFDESAALDIEGADEAIAARRRLNNKRLRMAKTLCKNVVKLYNKHDSEEFNKFVDNQFAQNFVYHDDSKTRIHSLTGTPNVQIHIESKEALKAFVTSHFSGVPDGVMTIERVRIRENGMVVILETSYCGTLIQDVVLPGIQCTNDNSVDAISCNHKDNSRRSFGHRSTVEFGLDEDQKIVKIEVSPRF